jgi:membrane protein DedA with SNARE-associated domain
MFDWLVETFTNYPYAGVAVVFLLCGLGLPLPEEIVLVSAGYVCFKGLANPYWMMAASAGAILLGDLLPYLGGRIFGAKLLRIRPLRMLVNKRRLAMFDRWFRRRGDLVIFFARFVAGLRVVAYFTAGTMRMSWRRFMALDLLGIALVAPLLVWVGARFGSIIDEAILLVQRVETGLLITALAGGCAVGLWWWLRHRARRRRLLEGPSETFVGPSIEAPDAPSDEAASTGEQ